MQIKDLRKIGLAIIALFENWDTDLLFQNLLITYLPIYSSGYGIMYPSGLGRGVLPTQKKASGPVPSYANPFINIVDSSTA